MTTTQLTFNTFSLKILDNLSYLAIFKNGNLSLQITNDLKIVIKEDKTVEIEHFDCTDLELAKATELKASIEKLLR